jgi:hypothetical protein
MFVMSCAVHGEFPANFTVKNETSMRLTVGETGDIGPGPHTHDATHLRAPITIDPAQASSFDIGLSPGTCEYVGLSAYDEAGRLVATLPSPICQDSAGHGNAWTIKQP